MKRPSWTFLWCLRISQEVHAAADQNLIKNFILCVAISRVKSPHPGLFRRCPPLMDAFPPGSGLATQRGPTRLGRTVDEVLLKTDVVSKCIQEAEFGNVHSDSGRREEIERLVDPAAEWPSQDKNWFRNSNFRILTACDKTVHFKHSSKRHLDMEVVSTRHMDDKVL